MLHYGWKYTYYIHEIQQRKNYSIVALELIKLPEKNITKIVSVIILEKLFSITKNYQIF